MKICWPRILLWITISFFGLGAILAGCGQKGPLYLPDKNKAAKKQDDSDKKKKQQN